LWNSAVRNSGLDNLEAVVLEVEVEMTLPDSSRLDPVRVHVLQEVGLKMENLES
jgi:hypothetical protein